LKDLDVWVIDALRHDPHPTHFHLDRALAEIERFKPKKAILTNLHVDLDYRHLCNVLPKMSFRPLTAWSSHNFLIPRGNCVV
jgi:phosphoribosyl 1,2-cyclic phosphate phosphodiesterase